MKEQENLRIDLVGANSDEFDRIFARLADTIIQATNLISRSESSHEKKESIEDLVTVGKDFFRAKLQKPTIENQKLLAEIAKEYAFAEEKLANAKRLREEAESIKLENAMKKLKSALEMISLLEKVEIPKGRDGLQIRLKKLPDPR